MIEGWVDDDGVPWVEMEIAGRRWVALVDTGYNGFVDLPVQLRSQLDPLYIGRGQAELAGGFVVEEQQFVADVPFDGTSILAEVTCVAGDEILLGTALLSEHRLEIDFPARTVCLERLDPNT
jgi:predicted aspartyl protease